MQLDGSTSTQSHNPDPRVQPNDIEMDPVEVEIEKETKTNQSTGRKQILTTRTDIGDPLMNQNKDTGIGFVNYKDGESGSTSTMLLVEVEGGTIYQIFLFAANV